ncbi:DUF1885 family protein [Thermaerobacillus caldiproteolyticus]|uniref:Two-component SAPR family response regulator n=1 Tax=Thermaerobacillus caldiproteolyticus TaxID=247480 RepID=A0A7W0BX34_9BACL|nr:DUF1885 family protein [Anoxybacillus caldiproteolyticus]MBA2874146.1 two-component SAPR family response regulator [Anoxybacillus caldiproteolyticus]QPA31904.1 DUF1885 family protein [Anoxybacillus caldiproteolyticus]
MSTHAYIKLVPQSKQKTITLEEVKQFLHYYQDITNKTGKQLDWGYKEAAFPYQIIEASERKEQWLYLKGDGSRYRTIIIGVGQEQTTNEETGETSEQSFIQITLPHGATHGDKGKANEFCKFLAKKLEGELHLFNGRVMYYYKR